MSAEGESLMEEILNGKTLDPDDWCYDAQKRVQEGSDGLWMRFGAKPGPSFFSQLFAFNFNPCVSCGAVVLLFGLVGFCAIAPGEFCSKPVTIYKFQEAGLWYTAKASDPQPFPFPTSYGSYKTELTLLTGTLGGSSTFGADVDEAMKQLTLTTGGTNRNITIKTEQQFENVECFMPQKEFDDWMDWVTRCFTWLYIITQDVWIVFAIYLWASKYGKVKLGRDDDEPEFTYFAWFSMLFTCGVATGLFYFAVSEPLYYYLTDSPGKLMGTPTTYKENTRWTYSGVYVDENDKSHAVYSTPNDRAQNAMTAVWYHWGLHGWVCYCILGVLLALLHFRKGLPMTIKSCFYPLIGTRIYGFTGDFLDTVSVVATTMGVCTSLGLGVIQLNSGLELLNGDQLWMGEPYYNQYNLNKWIDQEKDLKGYWDSWDSDVKGKNPWNGALGTALANNDLDTIKTAGAVAKVNVQVNQELLLIWIITASATCSVMLGLKNGIKQLALLCLGLGQFVIFYVWMMDDTWFLSNLFVQTLGHYIGTIPVLGFYASAVEQSEVNNAYGEMQSWQFWWTIFYWGWWIAWAPFVGVFLARVGKGRTVREFVFCTLFSACIYNFIFMTILGGAGIKMQMLAEKFEVGTGKEGTKNACSATELHQVAGAPDQNYVTKAYKANICRKSSTRKYSGEEEMFCSTITNLGCSLTSDSTRPLFDVLNQYGDVAKGMTVILLVTITLYFVASSDSGSMVDDMVTANGLPEPCLTQRLFWALTEGAAASALLSVGKYIGKADGGLRALRSASICVGLPYTFLICFMCVALYRALQYEMKDRKWQDGFRSCIMDIGITAYECGPSRNTDGTATRLFNIQRGRFDIKKLLQVSLYAVCPILPIFKIQDNISKRRNRGPAGMISKVLAGCVMTLFFTWFLFMFLDYLPISNQLQEWGSVMGDPSSTSGNTRYYLSNRWGYYHQWANKDSERNPGDLVRWNENVNLKGQERPLIATIDGQEKSVGVGERFAQNYRIAVIGWFFFFMFITFLVSLRSDVRVELKIQGTLMEDFLVCCFWPMALWQMEDSIMNMEPITDKAPPTAVENPEQI